VRVHHLNCGTMNPRSRRLLNGDGGMFEPATLVCHCLLIETGDGLVLVDSGIGQADIADPATTLGSQFLSRTRPRLAVEETAVHQVRQLGFWPQDVRHIVLTHLHRDHAGGISDFLWATVHVHAAEHAAAMHPPTDKETASYRQHQWAHNPAWATYEAGSGEKWFGFDAVRQLNGLPPEILLIPLPGHTRGHSGVAVDAGTGWLLHAGDAYFCHHETHPTRPRTPPGLTLFQAMTQIDRDARHRNRRRLRELRAAHSDEVGIISAHDPAELAHHLDTGRYHSP
jgi:glyoxylase-like metal-dependent hydrolase (beta-lactamase superfamily II)